MRKSCNRLNDSPKHHVAMFSGGAGSWAAAKRIPKKTGRLTLLFADSLIEDEDLYRFIDEAAADVGGLLVKVAEGRDPWQVFFDKRFLGNSRVDPCSRILKRELLRDWLDSNCDPADTTIYLGFDWTEAHRFERAQGYWEPWEVRAPLCDPPYIDKAQVLSELRAADIEPPRLYGMGFPHNNCGGFCIKQGMAGFRRLLEVFPARYDYHERKEQEIREFLGKDVAILRDRTGGTSTPLTLRSLREQIEAGAESEQLKLDWGGCGCFSP